MSDGLTLFGNKFGLQLYGNEWNFIEAENYRALLDHYFETQEAQVGFIAALQIRVSERGHWNSVVWSS